ISAADARWQLVKDSGPPPAGWPGQQDRVRADATVPYPFPPLRQFCRRRLLPSSKHEARLEGSRGRLAMSATVSLARCLEVSLDRQQLCLALASRSPFTCARPARRRGGYPDPPPKTRVNTRIHLHRAGLNEVDARIHRAVPPVAGGLRLAARGYAPLISPSKGVPDDDGRFAGSPHGGRIRERANRAGSGRRDSSDFGRRPPEPDYAAGRGCLRRPEHAPSRPARSGDARGLSLQGEDLSLRSRADPRAGRARARLRRARLLRELRLLGRTHQSRP